MIERLSIAQKGLIVIVGLLAIEFSIAGVLVAQLTALGQSMARERHIVSVVHDTHAYLYFMQRYCGDFMIAAFTPKDFLGTDQSYNACVPSMHAQLTTLEGKLGDDTQSIDLVKAIREKEQSFRAYAEKLMSFPIGTSPEPIEYVRLFELSSSLSGTVHALQQHLEKTQESAPEETSQELDRLRNLLFIAFAVNLVSVLGAAFFFSKRVTGRINLLETNIVRLANQEELLPMPNSKDEIGQITSIFQSMARELKQAAQMERALFLHSSDVLCSIDTRGIFLDVSPAAEIQWGYTAEQLVGKSVAEKLDAADLERSLIDSGAILSSQGGDQVLKAVITRSDGLKIETLWALNWSDKDGSFFAFVRDISSDARIEELLLAQEKELKDAIENMPLGIVVLDQDGFIDNANRRAVKMLSRGEKVLSGQSIDNFLSATAESTFSNAPSSSSELLRLMKRPNTRFPVQCHDPDISEREWYADVTVCQPPHAESANESQQTTLLIEDVTEQVLLRKMKENFVTVLGKNLHEPLAGVRQIASNRLETVQPSSKLATRLKRIVSNLDRLLKLIDELLDVERLGEGRLVADMVPLNVREIAVAAFESVRDHAEQQKIRMAVEPSDGAVNADGQRLTQVLVNLLTNAIKYSPAGTTVVLQVLPGQQGNIEFRVIDQGRGVPEHLQSSIFEPFVQTTSDDSKRGTGTGLGLAICKKIVEHHNGEIGVISKEGRGSIFWIKLPEIDDNGKKKGAKYDT